MLIATTTIRITTRTCGANGSSSLIALQAGDLCRLLMDKISGVNVLNGLILRGGRYRVAVGELGNLP